MAEIFEDKIDKWARFTCDCYTHILDLFCFRYGPDNQEYYLEISCKTLGYSDRSLWERVKIAFLYLVGKNSKRHSFWEFIIRKEDIKAFKAFVASLPEE